MDTGMENSIAIDAQAAIELQQKYAQEREKRIRTDGLAQYVKLSTIDKLTHFKEDPWLDPQALEFEPPALEDGSRCKFLSIGAGYGGLTFAVKLIQAGISVLDIRMVDTAGGFGGTWYWDRYPGLMCDVESYIYMPLLEEIDYAHGKICAWTRVESICEQNCGEIPVGG